MKLKRGFRQVLELPRIVTGDPGLALRQSAIQPPFRARYRGTVSGLFRATDLSHEGLESVIALTAASAFIILTKESVE